MLGRDAAERAIETAATTEEPRCRTRYRVPAGEKDDEIRLLAPVARRGCCALPHIEGHTKQPSSAGPHGADLAPLVPGARVLQRRSRQYRRRAEASVQVPQYCEQFDFELELAMVVGRRGKNIAKSDAPRYIAGYTIWNDFSARDPADEGSAVGMGRARRRLRWRQRHRPVPGHGRRDRSGRSPDDRAGERRNLD